MADKLRWGVLGAAGIAKAAVVPAIQGSRNGIVTGVASRKPREARPWAASVGIDKVVGSYDDILADPLIDAVYIPLPNSLHAEWTEKAARAGKAVLCEKPLALNAEEARRVTRTCAERNVALMEGFMYRFHPQHRHVRQLLDAGVIGELREVHAHLSVDLMNPLDPANVRFIPALGGGALLDMGCYAASMARLAFGEEPHQLRAWSETDRQTGVDVTAAAILEFSRGRLAMISCSFKHNGQGFYRLIGRSGMIDVPRAVIPGLGDRAAETLVISIDANGRRKQEEIAPADQYRLMAEAFADAVLKGDPVPLPPDDSIANMKTLDAMKASMASGGPVSV